MLSHGAFEMHALIDDLGEFVALTSPRILSRVGANLSRDAVVRFLVTNLGWIEIKRTARWIRMKCRPSIVSDATLASALFEMADHPETTIALSVLGSEWQHLVHAHHSEVATMLDGMRGPSPADGPVLLRRIRAPATSRHYAKSLALEEFCSSSRSHSEVIEFSSKILAGGRWAMSHFDSINGRLVTDHVSDGFTRFNANWIAAKGALSLDDYAGRAYSEWVAQTRAHAVSAGETIFDDVDATVLFPGFGFSRLLYARATIPVQLSCGSTYVISTSTSDTSIRLKEAG